MATSVKTAGTLPPGLTLSLDGVLRGTPTTPGRYTFAVIIADADGRAVEVPYTMVIR